MDTNEQNKVNHYEDEITLKDLILAIRDYFFLILSKWYWVVVSVLIFSAVFLYIEWKKPSEYTADVSFIVDSNDGNRLGGITAMLGQFGLGGGNKSNNLDRILYLASTQRMIFETLSDSVVINDKNDLFINHFLMEYEYDEKFEKAEKAELVGLRFVPEDFEKIQPPKSAILKSIHSKIVGGPNIDNQLLSKGYGEDTGVMNLTMTTSDDELSLYFVDSLFSHLSNFYITNSTKRAQESFDIVKGKTDSLKQELNGRISALTNLQETYRGAFRKDFDRRSLMLQGEIQLLSTAFGEATRNLEIASLDLLNRQPYITQVDKTYLPIKAKKGSLLMGIIKGIFIGAFLSILFIIIQNIITKALNEE